MDTIGGEVTRQLRSMINEPITGLRQVNDARIFARGTVGCYTVPR